MRDQFYYCAYEMISGYELPVAVCDSPLELAQALQVPYRTIISALADRVPRKGNRDRMRVRKDFVVMKVPIIENDT